MILFFYSDGWTDSPSGCDRNCSSSSLPVTHLSPGSWIPGCNPDRTTRRRLQSRSGAWWLTGGHGHSEMVNEPRSEAPADAVVSCFIHHHGNRNVDVAAILRTDGANVAGLLWLIKHKEQEVNVIFIFMVWDHFFRKMVPPSGSLLQHLLLTFWEDIERAA